MTGRRLTLLLAAILVFSVNAQALPVVVKLRPLANLPLVTTLLGGSVIDSIPRSNTYLLRLSVLPILTPLLRTLGVEWMEVNRGISLPAAPLFGFLDPPNRAPGDWYRSQPALRLVRAGESLSYSTGRGMMVADINSRVDPTHPSLAGHLTPGQNFVTGAQAEAADLNDDQSTSGFLDGDPPTAVDEEAASGFLADGKIKFLRFKQGDPEAVAARSHGTFVAGIIAVVAPDATIMPLRAFDDNGKSDSFTLAKAIHYATQRGVQIINMSFGMRTDTRVLGEAVTAAEDANIVLVASAGNDDTSVPQYPAAYRGVMGVAATDLSDVKASFSNYGRTIFVDAPGKLIISAIPDGKYSVGNGTSFSAAIVSGMAALVRSVRYNDVPTAIARSVINIDKKNPRYAGQLGWGRIDILAAVKRPD